jgi:hypothetical protein
VSSPVTFFLVTQTVQTLYPEGPKGRQKKAKIILTKKEQSFTSLFQSVTPKIDKPRKIDLLHVSVRDVSLIKQGT